MTAAEKLIALREIDTGIEVMELVKVSWPPPDGAIYYVATLDEYLLRGLKTEILPGANLDLRLPKRDPETGFQDILNDAHIADDAVRLRLWDGDGKVSDLAHTHGSGQRVEIFYWFPQVQLLLSQWWGHLQPVEEGGIEWFEVSAEVGFLSSNLQLPRRGFYTTCSNIFGGLLTTQREIDEGGCPYSRHISSAPGAGSFVSDTTWKCTTDMPAAGWDDVGFDDSGWAAAVDEGPLDGYPWNYVGHPPPFPSGSAARWIWNFDSRNTRDFTTAHTVYFRKTFTAASAQALLILSADESFTAWVNGESVAAGSTWRQSFSANLTLDPDEEYVIAVRVDNVGAGGLVAQLAYGTLGVGVGNLDPATGQPYTICGLTRPQCIARLDDDLSILAFDTVIQSYTVGQTKGPNITVTTRGNESNLKRPLRVIAGKRHVQDLDLLAYTVEPSTSHPEAGFVATLYAVSEGPIKSLTNPKVAGQAIAPAHLNVRLGDVRQARTGFSTQVSNYSSTALFFARAGPGDFTKTTADQLGGECDVEGLRDVRRYSSETSYVEEYSTDRAWWLMHILRNKLWGYGLDVARFVIQDWIDLSKWCQEIVSSTDAAGTLYTGQRTTFNAELIDRTVQQQVHDLCAAGRFSLPFRDQGKLRIRPMSAPPELLTVTQFTFKAYLGALQRQPDETGLNTWLTELNAAIALGSAALLTEAQEKVKSLFQSEEYEDLVTTNAQFVTDLYAAYLNRVPDTDGQASYLNDLANGATRSSLADNFGAGSEFAARVDGMMGAGIPVFSDRGSTRNICVDENRHTTLVTQILSDAEVPNRVVVLLDDEEHENAQRPLVFEDIDAQLRSGRAFGDTTRRTVEKQYPLLGVTSLGEATRLGNLLLHLGPFDDGGTKNNLRFQFTAWFSDCLTLRKYDLIKLDSARLDRLNEIRAGQGLEPFEYFRVRSMRRRPNLKVELTVQAYPREYYDQMESWIVPPPIVATGGLINPGGDPRRRPWPVDIENPTFEVDRIRFQVGVEEVAL